MSIAITHLIIYTYVYTNIYIYIYLSIYLYPLFMCVYVLCIFALLVLESPEARGMLSGGLGKPGGRLGFKDCKGMGLGFRV